MANQNRDRVFYKVIRLDGGYQIHYSELNEFQERIGITYPKELNDRQFIEPSEGFTAILSRFADIATKTFLFWQKNYLIKNGYVKQIDFAVDSDGFDIYKITIEARCLDKPGVDKGNLKFVSPWLCMSTIGIRDEDLNEMRKRCNAYIAGARKYEQLTLNDSLELSQSSDVKEEK